MTNSTSLKKWPVILIQGILWIILSVIFFSNHAEVVPALSSWITILILLMGVLGIIGYFIVRKHVRDHHIFWWSIITLILGILMLTNLDLAMKAITVIFGIWVLLTGLSLVLSGWSIHSRGGFGWLTLWIGILSIILGIVMIFNIYVGTFWISSILAWQAFLAGMAFIVLAFVKRRVLATTG